MSDKKLIGYPFYVDKQGKTRKYDFKGKYDEYEKICLKLWGCVPHDVNWAMNTQLYKNEIAKEHE